MRLDNHELFPSLNSVYSTVIISSIFPLQVPRSSVVSCRLTRTEQSNATSRHSASQRKLYASKTNCWRQKKIGKSTTITLIDILNVNNCSYQPYAEQKFEKCRICKHSVHQVGSHYCQTCAYQKGICAMCGHRIIDTRNFKQSCEWYSKINNDFCIACNHCQTAA